MKEKWKDLITPTNVVLVLWLVIQGGVYTSQWVWAKDMTAKLQTEKVAAIEQTVKVQQEAINIQHTFNEVVSIKLENILDQLDEVKATLKEMSR